LSIASLRRVFAVTALLALLASPAVAIEPVEPATPWHVKAGNIAAGTFDVLLLRPLGFIATVGGFTCYAIALPFSAINSDIKTPWDMFVMEPADWTFRRPLGEF
jgi:hypothetical protein